LGYLMVQLSGQEKDRQSEQEKDLLSGQEKD
jgi:hypothetical protein